MNTPKLFPGTFSKLLLHWYETHGRSLPWVGEQDPYRIWLSEVLLQQTRVEQGMPYYLDFIRSYPTVFDLAAAPESEVLKKWEGLGYYNRARNMLATARLISEKGGTFPDTPDELRKLKGIGPYTANAIASFAFGYPAAVVDGNVYRILSRVFGVAESPDLPEGKKRFATLADDVLDRKRPAAFNQAMMDLGSLVCTPVKPDSDHCPLAGICYARKQEMQTSFPVRKKRTQRSERYYHYIIVRKNGKWLIRQRTEQDFWKGLWEFPCLESDRLRTWNLICRQLGWNTSFLQKPEVLGPFRQQLTHRTVHARVFVLQDLPEPFNLWPEAVWVDEEKLSDHAFPVLIRRIFSEIT